MRKKILIVFMTLALSLSVTAVAFAHSGGYTYYSNGNSGWVSNGHHGHYWSGDFDGRIVIDIDDFDRYRWVDRDGEYYYCPYHGYFDCCFTYGRWDDGEWYYYKDKNGVTHYYYDDDDDGEWNYYSYVDKYGNTQYSRTKVEKIS